MYIYIYIYIFIYLYIHIFISTYIYLYLLWCIWLDIFESTWGLAGSGSHPRGLAGRLGWEVVSNLEERVEGSPAQSPRSPWWWSEAAPISQPCPAQATRKLPALTRWNLRGGDCSFALTNWCHCCSITLLPIRLICQSCVKLVLASGNRKKIATSTSSNAALAVIRMHVWLFYFDCARIQWLMRTWALACWRWNGLLIALARVEPAEPWEPLVHPQLCIWEGPVSGAPERREHAWGPPALCYRAASRSFGDSHE